MPQKIKKDDLLKEMADVKSLLSHLEEDYRKANISEKSYQELKEKYSKKLGEIETKLGSEKKDMEDKKQEAIEKINEEESKTEENEPKKAGIFGKLLKRKKEDQEPLQEKTELKPERSKKEEEIGEMTPEVIERLAQQAAAEGGVTEVETVAEETGGESRESITSPSLEIEKLKVMIDTIRESKRSTDEIIQTLSENIGEIRSMVFQTDGSLRETMLKIEKMEDDISEIKPKEIEKKFREVNDTLEKNYMRLEKLERKSEDLSEKINKVHEMLKGIGGVENLVNLNKDIQRKIEDIKEVMKYIERLAFKTEKTFIDLSRNLEDFVVYKAKQEALEEEVKDLIKSVDGLNLKFDNFPTKDDLGMLKSDILVIQNQINEFNKVLPIAQAKLPETIVSLRKEKDDILLFLDSLEEQLKAGTISIGEYESAKRKNLNKLTKIESKLNEEWKKISGMIEKGKIPAEEKVTTSEETKETKEEKKGETKTEETKEEEEIEELEEKEDVKEEEKLKKIKIPEKNKEIRGEENKKTGKEEMINVLKKIKEKIK